MIQLAIKRRAGYGWRRDTPDWRDRRRYQAGQESPLPSKAELPRPLLPSIRDQGETSACTGFAVRTAIHFVRKLEGEGFVGLSPLFAYYNGRVLENTINEDVGCEIRDVIKGVVKLGIAPEKSYPFDSSRVTLAPDDGAYTAALLDLVDAYERVPQSITAMRECIAAGFPFVFGFSCYENLDDEQVVRDGLLGMPRGALTGAHAVCAVAYDGDKKIGTETGAFLFANSWGKEWGCEHAGSRGYCWIPYRYIGHPDLAADFWAIRGVV